MRFSSVLLLLSFMSSAALAASPGHGFGLAEKGKGGIQPHSRQGGETVADAIGIPSRPFYDDGTTVGYIDDYDAACPDSSTSPDVVYWFVPRPNEKITIDLCSSNYDTKVYVMDSQQRVVACNDNAICNGHESLQSRIDSLSVSGSTGRYYIIIDGSNGESGSYDVGVELSPCPVLCPPGALEEGEPPCGPGYVDIYNGGCASTPPVFRRVEGQDGTTSAAVCGKSCSWQQGGALQGDADVYEVVAAAGQVSGSLRSEAPLELVVFSGDCESPQYLQQASLPNCETRTFDFAATVGEVYRISVTPASRDPVGEFDYLLRLSGIQAAPVTGACCLLGGECRVLTRAECGESDGTYQGDGTTCVPNPCPSPVPTRGTTWGQIKHLYR